MSAYAVVALSGAVWVAGLLVGAWAQRRTDKPRIDSLTAAVVREKEWLSIREGQIDDLQRRLRTTMQSTNQPAETTIHVTATTTDPPDKDYIYGEIGPDGQIRYVMPTRATAAPGAVFELKVSHDATVDGVPVRVYTRQDA